ncbi:type II toxin-antitoxin system HicA family toxin [Patescibacteria group bacterium]|nr:type II toxin-antitoxin system HicA family toxin [Patescibacteria group bacterium]
MGEKLPVFSSKKFIRAAKRLGFKIKKGGKGSHTRLVHPKSNIILSVPKAQTVSVGIRHQLIKNLEKIGISREKFIKLLSVGLLLIIKNLFKD